MAWLIELSEQAQRDLRGFDRQSAARVLRFLRNPVATLEDPCILGHALKPSTFGEFWRYRIGDDRLIARVENDALRVLVVGIGHRRNIYRR